MEKDVSKNSLVWWVVGVLVFVVAIAILAEWSDFKQGFQDGYESQAKRQP